MEYRTRTQEWSDIRVEAGDAKIYDCHENALGGTWGAWIDTGSRMRFVGNVDTYGIEHEGFQRTCGQIDALFCEREEILAELNELEYDAYNAGRYTQELIDLFFRFARF